MTVGPGCRLPAGQRQTRISGIPILANLDLHNEFDMWLPRGHSGLPAPQRPRHARRASRPVARSRAGGTRFTTVVQGHRPFRCPEAGHPAGSEPAHTDTGPIIYAH
jgi:hypothetical protein